ncbi:putative RNA-directed DNA polymerase from transposon X-element [Caerostris extrusa]|uniref:RNA-directed DNA polymerase from transposon X-element n=1 Tax=Caerostris extrusa TaxID=172846 RepID=A0AAV4N1D7_CAEEX|nr:putative RNA-directed DNA polymerase from transposon X-element [Caerostris extrusa]
MSDPFTRLKICYWNANGIYSKLADFKNFVHNHNPDVILLQETMLKPTQTIFIPNYNFFRNDDPQNPVSGGTAILIKNNIFHHEVPTPSVKSIKTTIISVHFANIPPTTIASINVPCRITTSDLSLISLLSYPSTTVQFSPATSTLIISNSYTGINLLNFSVRTGFEIIAPSTPTRYGLNFSSVGDLTILNNFHYTYDITSISELSSDHNPVLLNFNVNYITLNIPLKFPPTGKPLPNSFLRSLPCFLQILITAMISKPLWIISLLISSPPTVLLLNLFITKHYFLPLNQTSNHATK